MYKETEVESLSRRIEALEQECESLKRENGELKQICRLRDDGPPSESEDRCRAVIESQNELICRFLPNGTLTFVNSAYCRYFNKSKASLSGRTFLT